MPTCLHTTPPPHRSRRISYSFHLPSPLEAKRPICCSLHTPGLISPSSSGYIPSILKSLPAPLYQCVPITSFWPWSALFVLRKHFPINPLPSVHHPMSPQNIIVLCHFILVDTLLVIAFLKLCSCHCICFYLIYIPFLPHPPCASAFLFQRVFWFLAFLALQYSISVLHPG